jgi:hypothetical protein
MSESKSAAQAAYETLTWEELPSEAQAALESALATGPGVEPTEDEATFAELGYRAYVKFTGGLNYQGLPCPKWPDLPEKIRGAWAAASTAIRTEHDQALDINLDWLDGSTEEVVELIAALDAFQTLGAHRQHVLVPLRARLRAVIEPTSEDEPAPADEGDENGEGLPPASSPPPALPSTTEPLNEPPRLPTTTESELPKVSEAPPAPELKVDLSEHPATTEPRATIEGPDPDPSEVHAEPGSAVTPAVGVIPEGHVQTSEEAAHTQTPDTK